MPNRLTDLKLAPQRGPLDDASSAHAFAGWLHAGMPAIARQWASRIQTRRTVVQGDWDEVVEQFAAVLPVLLPQAVGPLRREVDPLLTRFAELFGRTAAGRGLAAGEAIEEFQSLRELVIRRVYDDDVGAPSLRDALRFNRVIDLLVTHASIGHTDALFFHLLDSDEAMDEEAAHRMADEALNQLQGIAEELESLLVAADAGAEASVGH